MRWDMTSSGRIGREGSNIANIYGYVRVSSKDQNEDRQMITLHEVGVPEKNI